MNLRTITVAAASILVVMAIIGQIMTPSEPDLPPALAERDLPPPQLPPSRSFLLSFTFQPHAWSESAFQWTDDFVSQHADMVAHYFDDGVPWEAVLEGRPFHADFQAHIDGLRARRRPRQLVLLGVNALAVDRKTLAPDWRAGGRESFDMSSRMPRALEGLALDHPEIVEVFVAYASRLITHFDPDFFVYSMEVNHGFDDAAHAQRFLGFAKLAYPALKARYPELPIALEFVLAHEDWMRARQSAVEALMPYTDLTCLSTYPYVPEASPTVLGDAANLPDNWFSLAARLHPSRPLAVCETGFNARSVTYWDRAIPGGASSQDQYLRFMLHEAQRLGFQFVNWWVPRDYDELWEMLEASGVDSAFRQWMTTGLVGPLGKSRPALDTWDAWHALPRTQ